MNPEKCDGMPSWPGIVKKTLKLLSQSKDRLLIKLLAAYILEEEQSTYSAQSTGT
jgi:hypothetical protein